MSPENSVEKPTIIFLHILKTAGTTLTRILERYYDAGNSCATLPTPLHPAASLERFLALSPAEKGRLDLLTGHMGYGLHRKLPRPAVYITLLRDPVERVISRYFHEQRDPGSHLHQAINEGMDLKEYVYHYKVAGEMDNLQTRMVAGNWRKRGFGPCDEAMLAQAKANLAKHFVVVGLTERFDEFYLLLARHFGWPILPFRWHNVTRKRPGADAFPPDVIAYVRENNTFDQQLYDYVAARMAADVAAQGRGFQLQLAGLRGLNFGYKYAASTFWFIVNKFKRVRT